ncbi:MAG: hypothetical protein OEX22_00065 [Cyclobacteriaceae bacterium]|nr:hypothetical protein [Cyclobacteriaceae bacterium]
MVQAEVRIVDYDKIKNIFSDNKEMMEQVMLGLLLTAHEKAPALKRYYINRDWEGMTDAINFIQSAFNDIASSQLVEVLDRLKELSENKVDSDELNNLIKEVVQMASYLVIDLEYYLSKI